MVNSISLLHFAVYHFSLQPIVSLRVHACVLTQQTTEVQINDHPSLKFYKQLHLVENKYSEAVTGYSETNTFQSH